MAFINHNENPIKNRVSDCVIRTIAKAENKSWYEIYAWLCVYGFIECDLPSANIVWSRYLFDKGYKRNAIDKMNYTVSQFCEDHNKGIFILALEGHIVCVIDGNYYDTWNSGDESVLFYWNKN